LQKTYSDSDSHKSTVVEYSTHTETVTGWY